MEQNNNIFFTSDTHFFHKNVIEYCNRPFLSIEEMNDSLIEKWNEKVSKNDTIYHLGDFSFGDEQKTHSIISRLNGKKHLIYGNHDQVIRKSKLLQSLFVECLDYKELNLQDSNFNRGTIKIVMSHFPFLQWNKSHYGSIMIHGHCHGSMNYPWPSKILDVGTDVHNYTPLSYSELKSIMKNKPIPKIDHH